MTETTLTLRVDDELNDAFAKAAEAHDRNAEDVLRDLMRDYVEQQRDAEGYGDWFRRQVEEGRRSADAGRLLDADEIASEFAARRSRTERKLGGRAS